MQRHYQKSRIVNVYRGEGRMLIMPGVHGRGAIWLIKLQSPENYVDVGKAIIDSRDYIIKEEEKPIPKDDHLRTPTWKLNSKYKSRAAFVKNNNNVYVMYYVDMIKVCSVLKSEEFAGQYGDIYKEIRLPINSDAEEIGAAVIEAMDAVDNYYADNKFNPQKMKEASVELLDQSILKIVEPQDKHFIDFDDYGVAEIYKCYRYISQDGAESSAEIFLGIAPELDCNLERINISNVWKDMHGDADHFNVQVVEHGIFSLHAEMKNTYYRQMEDDLLLECSIELYQPNRRKKLDDKLSRIFETFSLNCKL